MKKTSWRTIVINIRRRQQGQTTYLHGNPKRLASSQPLVLLSIWKETHLERDSFERLIVIRQGCIQEIFPGRGEGDGGGKICFVHLTPAHILLLETNTFSKG